MSVKTEKNMIKHTTTLTSSKYFNNSQSQDLAL